MAAQQIHPLVIAVFTASVATAAVFAWLALSNWLTWSKLRAHELLSFFSFCAVGSLDAGLVAIAFFPFSDFAQSQVHRLMWVTGPVSVGLWLHSVTTFAPIVDRPLRILSRFMFALAVLPAADLLLAATTGASVFYVLEPMHSRSIIVQATGDVNTQTLLADIFGGVTVLTLIVAAGRLLWKLSEAERPDRTLQVGALLTLVCGTYQAAVSGTDLAYNVPVLFMANLVEALRITWASQFRLLEQLEEARRARREQAALIDVQLEQLRLRERLAEVGEHTAQVSHDMRNPLTAVVGNVELAREELSEAAPNIESLKESFAGIEVGVTYLLAIVERITRQARPVGVEPKRLLVLRDLILDARALSSHRLTNVEVVVDVPEGIQVSGRQTDLVQVFMNLLSNAADALEGADECWIKVSAVLVGELVSIRFVDAGPRPPPAIAERMFRTAVTTRAHAQGTGLGLRICARIAEEHGGRIFLDPNEGTTTIVLVLPGATQGAARLAS
jgi:signal transduction histidine kinase